MIDALFLVVMVACGYSVVYRGRFRYAVVRGSMLDRVFGWINIAANITVAVVGPSLVMATGFVGLPVLAFAGTGSIVAGLVLYPLKAARLDLLVLRPGGLRAKPLAEQEKTRWPYQLSYGAGYVLTAVYVSSIRALLP